MRSGLPSAEWPVLQRCAGPGASASRRSANQSRATPATVSGRPGTAGRSRRAAACSATSRNGDVLRHRKPERGVFIRRSGGSGHARHRGGGAEAQAAEGHLTLRLRFFAGGVQRVVAVGGGVRRLRQRRPGHREPRSVSAGLIIPDGAPLERGGRRDGGPQQVVRADVEGVREALELVGGESPAARLDAADRRLVEAHPLGQCALAPALLLAQLRDPRADRLLMRVSHQFRHLHSLQSASQVRPLYPDSCIRCTRDESSE